MVEKRVLAFIKDLLKFMKTNKVNVANSAHGNSMRPFRKYFEKLTIEQMMKLENPYDDYFEYEIRI
jgi:bisphosphoglycerate-dependent phosphoglycerate mutase